MTEEGGGPAGAGIGGRARCACQQTRKRGSRARRAGVRSCRRRGVRSGRQGLYRGSAAGVGCRATDTHVTSASRPSPAAPPGDPSRRRREGPPDSLAERGLPMPLFEVETTSHIMIACVEDEAAARGFAEANYPGEEVLRVAHRPRDAWVISKSLLGHRGVGRPLRQGPRVPGQRPGRQAARDAALHAADRHRPGPGPQGDRVEHGDRLVSARRRPRPRRRGRPRVAGRPRSRRVAADRRRAGSRTRVRDRLDCATGGASPCRDGRAAPVPTGRAQGAIQWLATTSSA